MLSPDPGSLNSYDFGHRFAHFLTQSASYLIFLVGAAAIAMGRFPGRRLVRPTRATNAEPGRVSAR